MQKSHSPYQDDRELINRYYKDGDNNWLGILLEKYFHLIFGVCMRYLKDEEEAKEHTQQIGLKVIREFRQGKHEIRYFKSWLYQVTKNHCLLQLRRRKHRTVPLDAIGEKIAETPPRESETEDRENRFKLLENVLTELNEPQQSCIRLFYYEDKSYQEIADEKGYTLKQVKSFIQNGRRNIKVHMEKKEK